MASRNSLLHQKMLRLTRGDGPDWLARGPATGAEHRTWQLPNSYSAFQSASLNTRSRKCVNP